MIDSVLQYLDILQLENLIPTNEFVYFQQNIEFSNRYYYVLYVSSVSDLPLSYGIHDAKCHPQRVNFVEFRWNPSKDTSVFIKVNCISTEFTAKKHGGEKGVPFRVQVETYILSDGEEDKLIHCASCQVKVFKVHVL